MAADATPTQTMSPHRKQRKRRRRRTLGTIESLLTTTTTTIMILTIIIIIGQQPQPIACSGQQRTNSSISTTTLARQSAAHLTAIATTTTTTPTSTTTIIINNDNGKIPSTRQEEGEETKLDEAHKSQQTSELQAVEDEEEQETLALANKSIAWRQRQAQLSKRAAAAAALVPQSQQQQQQQQQLQFLQQLRVSESDLLPFSDFNVQQPAFSDIMKSWPPTTRRHQSAAAAGGAAGARATGHSGGAGGGHRAAAERSRAQLRPVQLAGRGDQDDQVPPARNHLNEDYDDTIVTADESFEQDQLPEPPTWVNYLGELGDFIYSQLLSFFDSSSRSPFHGGNAGANQTQTPRLPNSGRNGVTPIEIIDELLDDFYYDQYENSQVLYYGPQLVRQGDIFEIGCYLPPDQPAEWTKSGKSLVGGGGNQSQAQTEPGDQLTASGASSSSSSSSLRLIKSGDFLGAKRNYSLKVFEAQPSDSGNYRCNRLSRKYHKLIVVPARLPASQLYLVQQRLLSVVGSSSSSSSSSSDSQDHEAPETTLSQQQIQLATLYQQQGQAGASGAKLAQQQRASSRARQPLTIQASGTSGGSEGAQYSQSTQQQQQQQTGRPRYAGNSGTNKWPVSATTTSATFLVQGHLIREQQPLSVACHITDELVLRKLRELPHFQLAWYKNGKLLRGSQQQPSQSANNSRLRSRVGLAQDSQAAAKAATQRIQFLGPNGRQMFISSPGFSDAGDYLCSWAKMAALVRQQQPSSSSQGDQDGQDADTTSLSTPAAAAAAPADQADFSSGSSGQLPVNPLSAASHHQLVAPVKLRPFKSAYHVRQHDQLRLFCQVQRGYPAAQISWYVGNQLVDADYLREHPGEFRILQLQQAGGGRAPPSVLASPSGSEGDASGQPTNEQQQQQPPAPQIVEINPVPAGRQQMALTANGRGQWVNHVDLTNERYAIDTPERQLRYLQMKLGQLTGASELLVAAAAAAAGAPSASDATVQLPQQSGLSMLVVNKLDKERHASRYACRATTRANTDEVTTLIRVKVGGGAERRPPAANHHNNHNKMLTLLLLLLAVVLPTTVDSATVVMRPFGGSATLVPGQPLYFECMKVYDKTAQFIWYKRSVVVDESKEQPTLTLLEPNTDDTIEIHNERLTLHKPTYASVGDYICRALNEDKTESEKEFETIRLRAPPYVSDFGIETSHTGKSATIGEGERLELLCRIQDESVPVNISWLVNSTPDDDRSMDPITRAYPTAESPEGAQVGPDVPSYQAMQNVYVEQVDRFAKRLVIRETGQQHRGHYACMVDNGVTERTRKFIYIRVKDRIVALWPFLGILAELFILFTIIYVWETQRAQKTLNAKSPSLAGGGGARNLVPPTTPHATNVKRPPSGPSNAFESVPLNG